MKRGASATLAGGLLGLVAAATHGGDAPIALRVESFVVPPATGPVTHVLVQNLRDAPYEGTLRLKLPEGWKVAGGEQPVRLQPHETKRIPFAIDSARSSEANRYLVEVSATGGGSTVTRTQVAVCASAPYAKPRIDGRTADWAPAIPVTFTTEGRKTIIRTLWNRGHFCLLVEVEEARRIAYKPSRAATGFDAVQVALAPRGSATSPQPTDKAARYEFLLTGSTSFLYRDRCFLLLRPGMSLGIAARRRALAALETRQVQLAVSRRRGVTRYECAVPFSLLADIRPAVGREFFFSVLVHDPDGTGLRDWGEAAGLWPSQRSRLAWCNWQGARWGGHPPFDCRTEWGLCSSKD